MRGLIYNLAKPVSFLFDAAKDSRFLAMQKSIQERGGLLRFNISVYEDGWQAECLTIPGIQTGGTGKSTMEEIDAQVKDAIYTAFGIPPYLASKQLIRSLEEHLNEQPELSGSFSYGFAN
ncbi:MAG: hypothetical protein Q8P55_02195 [bacterium]|nr:hypothetical protein [bacterium]